MKRFAFRLQTVLDLAEKREEEEQRRLELLRAELAHKAQEITAMQDDRARLLAAMTARQQQVFDPREMHAGHLRLDVYSNDLARLRAELAEIERRVEAQRQVLVEAMRARKTLESFREKRYTEYRQEQEREELRTMEDVVLPRLARNR